MKFTNSILRNLECPKKIYWRYKKRFVKEDAPPLRIGSVVHKALEILGKTGDETAAYKSILEHYADVPPWADELEWAYEREMVEALVAGYIHYYSDDDEYELLEVEKKFEFPIGLEYAAGKMDGIVKHGEKILLHEIKTTASQFSDDDYWRKLNLDGQISLYALAARDMGYDVQSVLYDVISKPTFKPRRIPLTDENGFKITLDQNGERVYTKSGKPRESSSKADGYELQTRPEDAEEFGKRILEDVKKFPEKYYQRREIDLLESDLDNFKNEFVMKIEMFEMIMKKEMFYRNVSFRCKFCSYYQFCIDGVDPDTPPAGFRVEKEISPELKGE